MISLKEKIGYGLGDAASSLFWKLFGMYLLFFYTDVFGMEAAAVGTMLLIIQIGNSLFDPVVGIVADRTHSRWGKFRPYMLFLAVPFAVIGIFTFYTPAFTSTGRIIYAYVTYSLMMIVYSGINVPYASLLGVMSPDPKERNVLSTFRMAFAYLGSFVMLLLFMPMVNYFSGSSKVIEDQQHGWFMAVIVIAVASTILFLLSFAFTRERVKPIREKQSLLKEDIRDLLKNRPWWMLFGAGISALIFNSFRDGATIYYFKYFVDEDMFGTVNILHIPFVLSGLYLALGQAANLIGVMLAAPLSNRIGKRHTFMGAMVVATVLSIFFYRLGSEDIALIFVMQVVISICAGSIFPLLWSMYADCADYSEYTTGNRATGLIFSASSMSQKMGWAMGTSLTGWLLAFFGFEAHQVQNAETISGIKMFMSILPAVGSLLSVFFLFFYPLTEEKLQGITHALTERRENERI